MGVLSVKLAVEAMSDQGAPSGSVEFGWRVHEALDSWTGKVDTKASIALAIESAVVGFVVTLSGKGERFAHFTRSGRIWYDFGLGFTLFAVAMSLAVVFPQLNRRTSRNNWRQNMIFFGHLRRWDPKDLAQALDEELHTEQQQLAQQLVEMSKVAWRKHAWLQWSLVSLVLGAACLIVAAMSA
jgi:hypothetical protein